MNLGSDSDFETEGDASTDSSDESEEEQEEEQGAGALRIAAQANEAIINRRTVDGSYEREWKVFRKWVHQMRLTEELPAGAVYLTRLNVDLYFQQVVALKENVEPKTARRVVAALQCMARREEGLRAFQIGNGATGHVYQALQAQTQRYALRLLLQNNVDAHANLPTNSIHKEEFERAVILLCKTTSPTCYTLFCLGTRVRQRLQGMTPCESST
jgi:hypothetical protein